MSELQPLPQLAQFVLPDITCNHLQQIELLLARPSIGQMARYVIPVMIIVISVLEQLTQSAQIVMRSSTYNQLQQYDFLRAQTAIGQVVFSVPSVV
jgi:hypothetical protein